MRLPCLFRVYYCSWQRRACQQRLVTTTSEPCDVRPEGGLLPRQVPGGGGHRQARRQSRRAPESRRWRRHHPHALPRLLRRGARFVSLQNQHLWMM
jgi:hypothetical protein